MAEQNTNALAYQQLRPLENDNVGLLLEERNRWWRKYKDDQDAEKAKQDALKNKAIADEKKARGDEFQKLTAPDATLWFQDQVLTDYDENVSGKYAEYKRLYEETKDNVYLTKANIIFQKQKNLNETKQNVIDTAKYYAEQADKRNKYTDPDKLEELSQYADWDYVIKNQDIGTYDKDGKLVFESPSEFQTNKLAKIPYSGYPDWVKDANTLKTAIDTAKNNGEIRPGETEETKIKEMVKSYFDNDVNLRTWAGENKYIDEETGLAWTAERIRENPGTMDILTNKWTKDFIQLEKSTDGLNNAIKAENLDKAKRDNKKEKPTTEVATKEGKAKASEIFIDGKLQPLGDDDVVFTLPIDAKIGATNWNGKENQTGFLKNPILRADGNVEGVVEVKQTTISPVLDSKGNQVYEIKKINGVDTKVPKQDEKETTLQTTIVDDDVILGNMIRGVWNPKTKDFYKDLNEWKDDAREKAPLTPKTNTPTTKGVGSKYNN